MTDLHSHIIYGVDDGSSSLEESIEILKKLKQVGFDNVIMTPHYIDGSNYSSENVEKLEKLEILRQEVKKHNIDINLYLGNEVFINDHIADGIKNGSIYPLNNTEYVLFELPFHNRIISLYDIIFEMKVQGYIPVLAHPERYVYFQDNYDLVDELREEGLLFQCNFASILGYYGKGSQKLLKYMLKKGYVDFFGTDIHHANKAYTTDNFEKIEKALNKIAGKEYYKRIIANGDKLVK